MIVAFYGLFKEPDIQKAFFGKQLPAQAGALANCDLLLDINGLPFLIPGTKTVHFMLTDVPDDLYADLKRFAASLNFKEAGLSINKIACICFTRRKADGTTTTLITKSALLKQIQSFKLQFSTSTDLGDFLNSIEQNNTLNEEPVKHNDKIRKSKLHSAFQLHEKQQERQRLFTIITLVVAFLACLCAIILFLIHTWSQSSDRLADRIISEATNTRKVYIDEGPSASTSQSYVTFAPFDITDQLIDDDPVMPVFDTSDNTTIAPVAISDLSFLELDWSALKQKYPNLVGWLYIPGVEINYPIAQGTDNEFYLTHLIDGREGLSGWLFADCGLQNNSPATNYVIYGHNMADGSMFGHLKHVQWENWWSNPNNQYIYFATENYTAIYQVFNAMTVKSTQVYYHNINLDSSNIADYIREMTSYNQMGDKLTYSMFFDTNSKLITLSTCNDSEGAQKFVLQGVLVAVK